ncbi:MAG: prolyl oligopeptidase family serine peptidase [Longimicrobiales bacterium]
MFRTLRRAFRFRIPLSPGRAGPAPCLLFTLATAPAAWLAAPLPAQERPPVTVDDYGQWKRITSVALSPDGAWMGFAYDRLEGEDTLHVRSLDTEEAYTIPRGAGVAFSPDSRWVAYLVPPPEEKEAKGQEGIREGGEGGQESAPRTLVLRNLADGDTATFADVGSMSFPDNTGILLVRKKGPGEDADHKGADLIIHHLRTGTSMNLGNVSEFAVNKPGSHLAYLVDAEDDAGNGAYLLDLATGAVRPLDTDAVTYSDMAWNEEGTGLAILRGEVPEEKEERVNDLLILTELDRPGSLLRFRPDRDPEFPEGFVLSERGGLRWSEDSRRLFVGIKEQVDQREKTKDRADVDVWHWADVEVQSVQQVRARRDRDRTWASVVNLDGERLSFVRLADESLESVSPAGASRWGIGRDPVPYEYEVSWGGSRADYYRVDLDSGERRLLAEGVGRQMGPSPDGTWWLFLRNEEVLARNLAGGPEVNLTRSSGVDFINREDDHPYELPVYGVAGWTEGEESVLLYDAHDVWEVPLAGGDAVNLTMGMGEEEQIRFRLTRVEDWGGGDGPRGSPFGGGDEEHVDLNEPITLMAHGEWTKKDGYWQVEKGGEPEPLIWLDKSLGRPVKADSAQRIVFTQETFVEFPDYWVSDVEFDDPRKVTDANPQQAGFAWSPGRILVEYVDDRGNRLQGTLALPAGYEEGETYPMLVYFYEKMSDRHHSYQGPTYDDRPHMATYASNGYLVLQPDIVYTIGKPGSSALDDLTAAVTRVVEMGYADPRRIGLQGHSWGGYQSSFVVTQTDLFAAVVTGAPPTNLISFYNTLYRSTGTVQQGITEVGQVRMGTTPFQDFDLYVSQSPVHHAGNISTPFMILHGTEDGAVDWMQGLEYFNMARRLGKEVIFVSYPGEGHHLSRKENRIDFQIRMMQFFDHYLKDAPEARWMVEGVRFLEKEFADVREMVDGTFWGKRAEEEETKESEKRRRQPR